MSMIEDTSNAPTHAPWERFASGVMGTSHRAHLRLAYESLVGNDLDAVLPHVAHALRALATAHGQPTKFDPELTARWLRVVQQRMARQPTDDFEAFLAANHDLLDGRRPPPLSSSIDGTGERQR